MGMNNQSKLNMVCEEVTKLEWINRALRLQISFNENRLAELDKDLWELRKAKNGNDD